MNIAILTNEYPPYVYGGAGVHVEYLARELANLEGRTHSVRILCFGDQRERSNNLTVEGIAADFHPPAQEPRHRKFLETMHMCPLKLLPLNYGDLRSRCWPLCAQGADVSSRVVDLRRMVDGASWGLSRHA